MVSIGRSGQTPLTPVWATIIALAACAWWQRSALAELAATWLNRPEYSHGMLLPLLAGLLLFRERPLLDSVPVGSWSGFAILGLGVLLGLLGNFSTLFSISQYGVALIVCGLLLIWVGNAAARRVWIAFALLLLAVPLPNFLLNSLSGGMQLWSSSLGAQLMRSVGMSVYVEGNVIDLGSHKLQVAEACDGLRYVFPLLTIGFLMAYFFHASFWKRATVFLASVPLAIAMNGLRVATIGMLVERWGLKMAEGLFHEAQGWAMFMLSAALLWGLVVLLSGIGPDRAPWREIFGLHVRGRVTAESNGATSEQASRVLVGGLPLALGTAAGLLVLVAGTTILLPERRDELPQRAHLSEWPLIAGPWSGQREPIAEQYMEVLQLDDYVMANYTDGTQGPINFYVAYYDSQRSGHSAHSPRSCIPGGGWRIVSLDEVSLTAGSSSASRRVNRVVIELGLQRQVVYYWFEQRGRHLTNEYLVKWYIFWDALTRKRTDGALVRLTAPVRANQSIADVDALLGSFAARVIPELSSYIPG